MFLLRQSPLLRFLAVAAGLIVLLIALYYGVPYGEDRSGSLKAH